MRFRSTQRSEFKLSNNRRFADNKEMVPRKDYEDYCKFVNETNIEKRDSIINNQQRVN